MHDLPVSTTERRPETSLTEHSSNSSRIGRAMSTASHTGSQEERNPDSTGTTLEPRGQPCKTNWIIVSYGAGDGNRTHVRSLGSFYTAIVRRPLVVSDCTQELNLRKAA